MRAHRPSLFDVGALLSLGSFSCGSAHVASGDVNSAEAPRTSTSDSRPPENADSEPTTTTASLAIGDGGSPIRLPEQPMSQDASPGTNSPHSHEPGRGVADIRALVVARRDEARDCYDKGLADHPGLEGNLVIQWTIDPKGNVTDTSLDASRSQITEPGVLACVAEVIRTIHFSPSPGGYETKAVYPFNFHSHRNPRTNAP